jgi:hypothetical protein
MIVGFEKSSQSGTSPNDHHEKLSLAAGLPGQLSLPRLNESMFCSVLPVRVINFPVCKESLTVPITYGKTRQASRSTEVLEPIYRNFHPDKLWKNLL